VSESVRERKLCAKSLLPQWHLTEAEPLSLNYTLKKKYCNKNPPFNIITIRGYHLKFRCFNNDRRCFHIPWGIGKTSRRRTAHGKTKRSELCASRSI